MAGRFQPLELAVYYLIAVNLIAFVAFAVDKAGAEAGRRRISETALLQLALVGGTLGAWAGRRLFRHKTRKARFTARLGAVTALQTVAIGTLGYAGTRPAMPATSAMPAMLASNPPVAAGEWSAAYYPNCDAVRAAGKDPIYQGEPGYREPLDRDRDGVACEPFR